MAEDKKPDPSMPSADFAEMQEDWGHVTNFLLGLESLKENKEIYLPKFPEESANTWDFRVSLGKLTNIFRDVVENLASRPFATEVEIIEDSASEELVEFSKDVDAQGNSLHVFAESCFFNSIAHSIDWIVVDYTGSGPEGGSIADEKAAGVRPFWRRYSAPNVVACYSAIVDGKEQFVHVRMLETHTERMEFEEETKERVRVWNREQLDDGGYGPPTFEIWEKEVTEDGEEIWVQIVQPTLITLPIIPLVPVITGRRMGASWRLHMPMKPALDLQRVHFRQESALEYAKTMCAFPILTANGITPRTEADGKPAKMEVGPQTILYAPLTPGATGQTPSWDIIEPGAESLSFLANDVKETAKELRELGRQPLTSSMGNITVITSAVAGQKGAAAIQSWSIGLKLALEKALYITSLWLASEEHPDVAIDTDFDLTWTDDDGYDHILKLRELGDMSREAAIREGQRRSIIDKDYDAKEDAAKILEDQEDTLEEESGDEVFSGQVPAPGEEEIEQVAQ